jgi:hypothetical protein
VDLGVNDPILLWMLVQDNTAPQDWSVARNIAQTVQGSVTAAAAVGAVVWGLYVFRVGRHSAGHGHIQIDLTKVINTSKGKVAVLSIKLKNTGRTRIERDKDKEKCCLRITPIRRNSAARHSDAQIVVLTPHKEEFNAPSDCRKQKGWVIFENLTALEPDEETAEDALFRWDTFDDFLGTRPMFNVAVTFKGGSLRLWGQKMKTWGSRRIVIIDNDAVAASENAQGAAENQANGLNKQIPSGEQIEDKPVEDEPSGRFMENIEDLREKNLPGKDLRNADLRNADLRNADLRNADLRDADLRNADLREANLRRANLSRANLSNANLSKVNLRGATMVGATMTGATMPDGSKHD